MENIQTIKKELKTVRKNNGLKKSTPVAFMIHGNLGLESIALNVAEAYERKMSSYGKLYTGDAMLLKEQDENPYTYPTFKEVNKTLKQMLEFGKEGIREGWLAVESLCKDIHLASEVVYSEKDNLIQIWTVPIMITEPIAEN